VEDAAVLDDAGTDTARLREAGASPVVWAIARESSVASAWAAVQRRLSGADVVIMEGSTIVSVARPDLQVFVAHPWLSPDRWKGTSAACVARADVVIVNRPGSDARPPSPEVLDALRRLGGPEPIVADVTRPPSEWAPKLTRALVRAGEGVAAVRA